MKYRNVKTGAIIEVTSNIEGKDWEALNPPSPKPVTGENRLPKKGSRRKGKDNE